MNDKQLICPFCGGNLTNQGEELASNVKLEYQGDTTAKVRYLICDKCHRDFEVYDPKSAQSAPSVVSPHPSDISHLKKSVPLSPAMFCNLVPANNVRKDSGKSRTFAAVAATLLTLGCTDAGHRTALAQSQRCQSLSERPRKGRLIIGG